MVQNVKKKRNMPKRKFRMGTTDQENVMQKEENIFEETEEELYENRGSWMGLDIQ